MNFSKLAHAALLPALSFAVISAHAQGRDLTSPPAPAPAPAPAPSRPNLPPAPADQLAPASMTDVQVMFNKAIDELNRKIQDGRNLSPEQRAELSRILENQADEARAKIDATLVNIGRMFNTNFTFGIIVTVAGEATFPIANNLTVGPAAEIGVGVYMKNTGRIKDVRTSGVFIGGGFTEAISDTNALQNRSGVEAGIHIKFLIVNAAESNPVVSLRDFEGFYLGLGAEGRMANSALALRGYGQQSTCKYFVPFYDCRNYIFSIAIHKATNASPLSGGLKVIYLALPLDKNGRGFAPFGH